MAKRHKRRAVKRKPEVRDSVQTVKLTFLLTAIAVVVLIFLSNMAWGADVTPYNIAFIGNDYGGTSYYTPTWLAERADYFVSGGGDWPGLHDSIYDSCQAWGKDILIGPYRSTQEINLSYGAANSAYTYDQRIVDTTNFWPYIYAKHYMDSIGVDVESLVVHVDEDMWAVTQETGSEYRKILTSGLNYKETRWCYQTWNNTSGDTAFYPSGYSWMANGYNADARRAIAYAFRRHFIEDSSSLGPWTCFFADNQYRRATSASLPSYYTVDSTRGGSSSDLDLIEQTGFNTTSGAQGYFDNSLRLLDSTIKAVLDSTCDAEGLTRIKWVANTDRLWTADNAYLWDYVPGFFNEQGVNYDRAWPDGWGWEAFYNAADTLATRGDMVYVWCTTGDLWLSSDPGSWLYDSSRYYMAGYGFFLTVQDSTQYWNPHRWNDTTRWRKIYEIDFGDPDSAAYEAWDNGLTGSDKVAIMRRDYTHDGSDNVALFKTTNGSTGYTTDTTTYALGGSYYHVSVDGDTAETAVSTVYMLPYSGWTGISASGGATSTGQRVRLRK